MVSNSPDQKLVKSLVIALIIFINLTLALAVTTYLFLKKADENLKLLEATQRELGEESSMRLEAVNKQRELVRDVLGLPEDLDNAEILRRRKTAADDASGQEIPFRGDFRVMRPAPSKQAANAGRTPEHPAE